MSADDGAPRAATGEGSEFVKNASKVLDNLGEGTSLLRINLQAVLHNGCELVGTLDAGVEMAAKGRCPSFTNFPHIRSIDNPSHGSDFVIIANSTPPNP